MGFVVAQDLTVRISRGNRRGVSLRRSWHHAGNPRRPRRLYLKLVESPERRQAGDLHRRQPRAEGRRLPPRAATACRHGTSRGIAGGSLSSDRGRGRAPARPLFAQGGRLRERKPRQGARLIIIPAALSACRSEKEHHGRLRRILPSAGVLRPGNVSIV